MGRLRHSIANGAAGAELYCARESEEKKTESAFVSCQSAQQKKAVADHSSVFGQIKERQGRKREHRFILSFSIYPFSPQKITSHFVLGGRLLKLSYSPPQPSMLLCVLVFPVSVYCGPGVSIDNCFYLRLLCTAYNPHTVEVFKPISPLHTDTHTCRLNYYSQRLQRRPVRGKMGLVI